MTDTIANQSPGHDHAHAEGGSSVVQIRLESKAAIGVLIAFAVVVMICIGVTINLAIQYEHFAAEDHHLSQQKWLHDSDLSDFQRGPFNDLQREVEVSQKLFQTCKR